MSVPVWCCEGGGISPWDISPSLGIMESLTPVHFVECAPTVISSSIA